MEQLVEDAIQILDHLQIDTVRFCGLSIGGMIAQGVGILHSDRIASLILCDTQSTDISCVKFGSFGKMIIICFGIE